MSKSSDAVKRTSIVDPRAGFANEVCVELLDLEPPRITPHSETHRVPSTGLGGLSAAKTPGCGLTRG